MDKLIMEKEIDWSHEAQEIIHAVAQYYDLPANDILSMNREHRYIYPRMIMMYLMHDILPISYKKIGIYSGGRDHTTAMCSCQKVKEQLSHNIMWRRIIDDIKLGKLSQLVINHDFQISHGPELDINLFK